MTLVPAIYHNPRRWESYQYKCRQLRSGAQQANISARLIHYLRRATSNKFSRHLSTPRAIPKYIRAPTPFHERANVRRGINRPRLPFSPWKIPPRRPLEEAIRSRKRNDRRRAPPEMESVKLTEGTAYRRVAPPRVAARTSAEEVVVVGCASGGHARAMIDVPELRACPPSKIKSTNRADEWLARPLSALLVSGLRRGDPMADFSTRGSMFSRGVDGCWRAD